ncbi:hypothetical protein LX36DRAFT_150777 [Colletotrichum falcatum]|nr:hypothetical protein LX36DRAFT_150777 [Colletotrichum falcatum]
MVEQFAYRTAEVPIFPTPPLIYTYIYIYLPISSFHVSAPQRPWLKLKPGSGQHSFLRFFTERFCTHSKESEKCGNRAKRGDTRWTCFYTSILHTCICRANCRRRVGGFHSGSHPIHATCAAPPPTQRRPLFLLLFHSSSSSRNTTPIASNVGGVIESACLRGATRTRADPSITGPSSHIVRHNPPFPAKVRQQPHNALSIGRSCGYAEPPHGRHK